VVSWRRSSARVKRAAERLSWLQIERLSSWESERMPSRRMREVYFGWDPVSVGWIWSNHRMIGACHASRPRPFTGLSMVV